MKKILLFLSAGMFLFACNNAAPEAPKTEAAPKVNVDSVKAAIAASNEVYGEAFAKGDSSSFINCYTSDACINPPNAPKMCGTEALAGFFRMAYSQMGVRNIMISTTEVYTSGEYATEEGTYELQIEGNKTVDKGKFLVLWKNVNGSWKMFRDVWNSDNPPPPPPPSK